MLVQNMVNCWNPLRATLLLRAERQSECLKSVWIGQSAAEHRTGEGSTTSRKAYHQVMGNGEYPKYG